MSPKENGQPVDYHLSISGKVAQEFVETLGLAKLSGLEKAFRAARKSIFHRLRTDPLGFGELVQNFPFLRLIAHVGTVYPLTVRFAIDEEHRIVYLMKVILVG